MCPTTPDLKKSSVVSVGDFPESPKISRFEKIVSTVRRS
jgi:hypothetical protein